jgi:hypothetical protein
MTIISRPLRLSFFFFVVAVACLLAVCCLSAPAAATPTCSGVVDPYSGVCLTVDDVLLPCDEATAISKCGCATCALPGCECMVRQCSGSDASSNAACACPSGWRTEFAQFPCASRDPLVISAALDASAIASGVVSSTRAVTSPAALNALRHSSSAFLSVDQVDLVAWGLPVILTVFALFTLHFFVVRA